MVTGLNDLIMDTVSTTRISKDNDDYYRFLSLIYGYKLYCMVHVCRGEIMARKFAVDRVKKLKLVKNQIDII